MAASLAVAIAKPAYAAEQDQLKAAIVYNIIRFTRFVPPPEGGVSLCVLASGALSQAIATVDGKAVPDGRVQVRIVSHVSELRAGCTIAYIGANLGPPNYDGVPMVIGETADFAERGGAVGLTRFGRQISFELNPKAAAARGVRFSSRLLSLASLVHGR
ncbi:YfiR family protein [uncultured Sphingomonas sp.]|uniref:YfiR family protein n=1 Tax=uncultured Sphingomonas sp. TaxID=158754 RepID=UPI0025E3D324|nr:YfiR family protein [uncultured Sphingomonas sp.]